MDIKQYNSIEYKIFPKETGVYLIGFKGYDKVYVGSASLVLANKPSCTGFYKRWKDHLMFLRKGKHFCRKLQHAFNKYGENLLYFSVLQQCAPNECLKEEQKFIDAYDACDNGYNSRQIAQSQLGFKHSSESKQKMRDNARLERNKIANTVISLYTEKKSCAEIGRIMGIQSCTVIKILCENDINLLPRNTYKMIKIYQYDKLGNFVKEWANATECAKQLGLFQPNIRKVLNNELAYTGGFLFSFKFMQYDETIKLIQKRNNKIFDNKSKSSIKVAKNINYKKMARNIKQYDIHGQFIKEWQSSRDIKKHFDTKDISGMFAVLRGKKKTFKQYIWKY